MSPGLPPKDRSRREIIGRIADLAARVEDGLYRVAADIGISRAEARALSATRAAERILAHPNLALPLPPWMVQDVDAVRSWVGRAKGVVKQRNQVLHAIDVHVLGESGMELQRLAIGSAERKVPTTREELWRVERDLDATLANLEDVRRALMMCVRPGVYHSYFAGETVFSYEDAWPPADERAALKAHLEIAFDWGDRIMRGERVGTLERATVTGLRIVPPCYDTPLKLTPPAS